MFKITLLYLILTCLNLISCKFSNIVQYPNPNQKVFKYDLHIEDGLSMSINNKKNGEFDPVDFNLTDGEFYVRDKDLFHKCNLNKLVFSQEELDSIVTVDGRHRTMIFVNGQFPGPPIVVPKGAEVEITVHNHFRIEVLGIHWHGQAQLNSFQMDGVSRITQCGIQPGEAFTYKFKANDAGTHWYHSHSSVQRTDGAIGPFIVIDQNLKQYDQEFYFFVQDWQHLRSEDTVNLPIWGNTKFWNGYNNSKEECFYPLRIKDASMMMMKADTFIINGKGWYDLPTKIENLNSFNDKANKLPLEHFKVKPNKRYLFRGVGANMAFPIMISVNGHKINLVSSDGNPIKPINDLDYIIINGGERYDFELVTKDTNDQNFYFIIQAVASFDYNFNNLNQDYFGIGILEYENSKNLTYINRECTKEKPCKASNCPYLSNESSNIECINLDKMKSANNVISDLDKSRRLFETKYNSREFEEYFFNFHFSGETILRSSVNGKQFKFPNAPPFFPEKFEDSIKGNECKCSGEQTCHCTSHIQITPGKVIQFVVYNMGKGAGVQGTAHPIHLHGHHFYLMSVGYPNYSANNTFVKNNKDLLCKEDDSEFCNDIGWTSSSNKYGNIPNANLIDPIKKDTVLVPVGGYVVIRFYSDNIGYWFFHCHVEVHATEGMATLIQEGTDAEIRNNINWDDMHTCAKGYTKPKTNSAKNLNSSLFLIFFIIFLILVL